MPLFLVAWLAACCWTASAETITGVVIKVRDGDTVVLQLNAREQMEVRLNAIDAPEKGHGGVRGQPYSEQARQKLEAIAIRRRATLESHVTDRYGRRVGVLVVHTPYGAIDAGYFQVQAGYAWVNPHFLPELPVHIRKDYLNAEATARAEQKGLWRTPGAQPPWEWRLRHPRQ